MSDNLLLNKIWNPLTEEFEQLSNDLLKKYISNFMTKKDKLNIMSGGTDPASAVTINNYFDIGNANKYVGDTSKRRELRRGIKDMIDAINPYDEKFREFLKFMRDFHYTAFISKKDVSDPSNVASCLARIIRENDYHKKIGLPSLMLKYKNVFDNKNTGDNMAVEVGGVKYVLDSTTSPKKEDKILSLYKGDVEKLKNFGNQKGDIEHGLASNTVRILMREWYKVLLSEQQGNETPQEPIRQLQRFLLWREISTLNMSRSNHNVPIDIFYLILKIIASTPNGARGSGSITTDFNNYINNNYHFEDYTHNNASRGSEQYKNYFAKYKLKKDGFSVNSATKGTAVEKLKTEGEFITNAEGRSKMYTLFPRWLYKGNNAKNGNFKDFHKIGGAVKKDALTTTQLISLTNIVLRFYHVFKILHSDETEDSNYEELKKILSKLTVDDVRDDIVKSMKITKMFIIDGAKEVVKSINNIDDLADELKSFGVTHSIDIDPSIYIGIFFYKMSEILNLDEVKIIQLFQKIKNDEREFINSYAHYELMNDGYFTVNYGPRTMPKPPKGDNVGFCKLLSMIVYRSSRWALHKHFGKKSVQEMGGKRNVTKFAKEVDLFGAQFSDSRLREYYKVGKDLYDNAKQLFEHSKKDVDLDSLTPPAATAAQMIQGGGVIDVKETNTGTTRHRMNDLIRLRKQKRLEQFRKRRMEGNKTEQPLQESPDSVFGVSQAWSKDKVLPATDITSQRFDEIYENLLNMQLEQQTINQSISDVVIDFLICNAECEEEVESERIDNVISEDVEESSLVSPRKRKPTLQPELQTKRGRNHTSELPTIKSEDGSIDSLNSFPDSLDSSSEL
jgi:hypothetical protein